MPKPPVTENDRDPMWPGHDPFTCECHETCSWCTQPVLDSSLRQQPDGARICRDCVRWNIAQRQVRAW